MEGLAILLRTASKTHCHMFNIKNNTIAATIFVVAIVLSTVLNVVGAPFTSGNIVVYRVGTGGAALTNAATAVFIDEYTPAGALVQSITMPVVFDGANRILTASGTATSEGFLSRTSTGNYIVLSGYDAAPGTGSITGSNSSAIARVIGRIDVNGLYDTTTAMTEAATPGNPRGATSTNGMDMWFSTSGTGVRYIAFGSNTTTQLSTSPTNTRVPLVYFGQMVLSSASGLFQGLSTIGLGAPVTSGQTTTILPGFPTATGPSPYQYAFLNGATVYVADDRAIASGGGLQKWTLSGGTWTLASTYTGGLTAGLRGLTLTLNGLGQAVLFASTADAATKLVTLTEDGSLVPSFTTIATAPTNTAFRGIAMTPNSPVAAGVTVGGRITDSNGRGLGRVAVTISGGELTRPLRTMTSPFGYYLFDDLTVGSTYIVTVGSKQYAFTPNTRVVSLTDAVTDVDFTADSPTTNLMPLGINKR